MEISEDIASLINASPISETSIKEINKIIKHIIKIVCQGNAELEKQYSDTLIGYRFLEPNQVRHGRFVRWMTMKNMEDDVISKLSSGGLVVDVYEKNNSTYIKMKNPKGQFFQTKASENRLYFERLNEEDLFVLTLMEKLVDT